MIWIGKTKLPRFFNASELSSLTDEEELQSVARASIYDRAL
jgi:hypothetical protein